MSETALDIPPQVSSPEQVLAQVFGYREFRPGQREVIQTALDGHDSLVIMPTGGGKSVCYQIPALLLPGLTLVVSPLISLMKDQVDSLVESGVAADYINSTRSREQVLDIFSRIRRGELKLLYVSPERLLAGTFLERVRESQVSFVAVDEAHCISQWGHDFRPDYAALGRLRACLPGVPMMALTATADKATRHDIVQRLQLQHPFEQVSSFDRPNIRYTVAEKLQPMQQLKRFLSLQKGNSGIIYCGSRRNVERVADALLVAGYKAAAYHAGLEQDTRASVQERFLCDELDIVVATVAFGMGINKSNVRFVVHYDLPKSIESYYQEVGRAGRDGLESEALLLFDPADEGRVRSLLSSGSTNEEQLRVELHKLHSVAEFAAGITCRRQVLLNYFDEPSHKPCGNCDICLNPPTRFDGLEAAQKVLSCVYRLKQGFGVGHTVEVLMGTRNQAIAERGHDKLSTFAIGQRFSHDYWYSVTRQLIHLGFLSQDITRGSALSLNAAARTVLKGEQALELAEPRLIANSRLKGKTPPKNYDRLLFNRLRGLRKSLADEHGVPPYVVFSDASLVEMAQKTPTQEYEFLDISGVGQTKLERYGADFMAEIESYLAQRDA
ncbi:DNA helicase RecQ [Paraferrimonas sedimenticola]|uniref:DNA helicase RecQ n=1 Tax=Paraferrimonas sedimenticola TaxID=375674 RepID=A0AA37RUT1_9GAMM|nr:DNA helicase RecQ [Paraferrimonas sedimenticola]GLP95267.1 ATP-dependent DNA helicase RecQ [Paraferrimonas sedimenticola]